MAQPWPLLLASMPGGSSSKALAHDDMMHGSRQTHHRLSLLASPVKSKASICSRLELATSTSTYWFHQAQAPGHHQFHFSLESQ